MALPEFNDQGDLPEGLHKATLADVLERFGRGSEARQEATAVLQRIHRLVTATGRARGAVGASAHGGACMARRWRRQILPLGDLGLDVTHWICEQRAPVSTG